MKLQQLLLVRKAFKEPEFQPEQPPLWFVALQRNKQKQLQLQLQQLEEAAGGSAAAARASSPSALAASGGLGPSALGASGMQSYQQASGMQGYQQQPPQADPSALAARSCWADRMAQGQRIRESVQQHLARPTSASTDGSSSSGGGMPAAGAGGDGQPFMAPWMRALKRAQQ